MFVSTSLFNEAYYLLRNPDVAAAVARVQFTSGRAHFEQFGQFEVRDISPLFDVLYYLAANPDVAAAGVDPLQHYLQFGENEGRSPSIFFDPVYYLTTNPDVAASGMGALEHYLQFGGDEGRNPSAGFDSAFYVSSSPDVAASGMNPLVHFITYGLVEQRPNTLIDFSKLAASNPTFAAALIAGDAELLEDIARAEIVSAARGDIRFSTPAPILPVNTLPATYSTNEDTNLTLSGISIADSDTPTPASVTISTTNGILNISDNVVGGITAGQIAGNGTNTIIITGATLTEINATLVDANGITFVPTTDYHGDATVAVTTDDGALTDTDTSTVTVTNVNDVPVLSDISASTAYTQNGAAVVIDNSATITDVDDTHIESATVAITANFNSGDRLNFTNQNGITSSYNAFTGVLTLTGSATKADYETALESITFDSNSAIAGDRTIRFVVNDGDANSTSQPATITYSVLPTLTGLLTDQNTAANQAASAWTFDASTAFGGGGTYSLTTTDQLGNAVTGYSINSTTGIITNTSTIANTTTAYIFTVTKTGGGSTVTENFDLFTNAGALTGAATTGADTITATANSQRIWGGDGSDSITDLATYSFSTIHGGDGNDSIHNRQGISYGGTGNDSIIAQLQNTVFGGDGNDTVTVSTGSANLIYGGAGTDSITANSAADTINGGTGDDTITAAAGADSLTGGTGNDYFRFVAISDSTTTARDTITDFAAGDKLNILLFDGFGTDEDKLTATFDGTNTIVTANTTISGVTFSFALTGDVTALMTNANIVYSSQFNGTAGNDTLTATASSQAFFGDAGDDSITDVAIYTSSTIHGGDGNDTIHNRQGISYGGTGNDSIIAQLQNTVFGGNGNDTVTVSTGSANLIYGGAGTDSITANSAADTIYGGVGDDTITGGGGADNIFVGSSDAAVDRIVYSATNDGTAAGTSTGFDTISEFEVGTDKIAFTSTLNTNFDDLITDDLISWVTNNPANFTTTHEAMLITGLTNANLTEAGFTTILNALNVTYGIIAASGNDGIIAVQGTSQTAFFLFTENGTLANNIVSTELTLLGITNGQLTTSDFIFA